MPPAVSGGGSPSPAGCPARARSGRARPSSASAVVGVGLVAEQGAQGGADDPAEGPLGPAAVEDGDLELGRGQRRAPRRCRPAVTGLTADSARTPTSRASDRPMPAGSARAGGR